MYRYFQLTFIYFYSGFVARNNILHVRKNCRFPVTGAGSPSVRFAHLVWQGIHRAIKHHGRVGHYTEETHVHVKACHSISCHYRIITAEN